MITAENILQELEQLVFSEVLKAYPEKTALACANALIDCLYLNFKNQLMYIPTSNNLERSKIHLKIYNDFTGNNHKDLSVKYKLSLPAIYKIVNTYNTKYINSIQNNIFDIPEENIITPITLIVINEYLPSELVRHGLTEPYSLTTAKKVSEYLLSKYPGISISISNKIVKKRFQDKQSSLF